MFRSLKIQLIFLLGSILTLFSAITRQIENLVFKLEGVNIIITYHLIGNDENIYLISVFSSHNKFV